MAGRRWAAGSDVTTSGSVRSQGTCHLGRGPAPRADPPGGARARVRLRAAARASAALVVATFTLAAAPPAGAGTGEARGTSGEGADGIEAALDRGQIGEAHRLAREAVARSPEDPHLRYLAAAAAARLIRLDEADQHVAAGLRRHPEDAPLLGLRSVLEFWRGDFEAARASSTRSLTLDRSVPDARVARAELEVVDQGIARRGGADPNLEPGTPAAFVDALMARVAAGAPLEELVDWVDERALVGTEAGPRDPHAPLRRLSEMADAARAAFAGPDQRLLGWVVSRESTANGEHRVVAAVMVTHGKPSREFAGLLFIAVDDPAVARRLDRNLVDAFRSVDPAERAALVERLGTTPLTTNRPAKFDLVSTGESWKLYDVEYGGTTLRRWAEKVGRLGDRRSAVDGSGSSQRATRRAEAALGALLFVVALAAWRARRALHPS